MKEIEQLLAAYDRTDHARRKFALATVVGVAGSSYRRPGAKMLITDDGRWEGAISGGCLEGDALRRARQVMLDGQPTTVRYDTMDDDTNALGLGLGCNGILDVFIEPIHPADPHNPVALLRDFARQRDERAVALVVRADVGTQLLPGQRFVLTDPAQAVTLPGWFGADLAQVWQRHNSGPRQYRLPTGAVDMFFEWFDPGIELVVFGAGYDVVPLVRAAAALGWSVTVTEDCVAHLAPARFPAATCLLYAGRNAALEKIKIGPRTAAVLMSHNYHYDQAVLHDLLTTDMPYIGMLGPRKRFEKMHQDWVGSGQSMSDEALSRVHAPIGLDIGAETPDEIALAVLAEIRAFFSQRAGGSLHQKTGPIHERAEDSLLQLM